MLARPGAPCDGEGWAYEVKFDGMRAQLGVEHGEVRLRSRPGRDCTDAFPELAPLSAASRKRRLLLDGELVCLNDTGDPDFARLRARLRSTGRDARLAANRSPATFLAFDLLHFDGRSTRELPYAERRALLEELAFAGHRWQTPRTFASEDAPALLEATRERGLEGVVMKRLDAPYMPGVRSAAWLKHKHRRSESFLITGWVPASGRRGEELLLARIGPTGLLAPAGSVSLGYHGELRERIQQELAASVLPRVRAGSEFAESSRRFESWSTFTVRQAARCGTPCCEPSRPAASAPTRWPARPVLALRPYPSAGGAQCFRSRSTQYTWTKRFLPLPRSSTQRSSSTRFSAWPLVDALVAPIVENESVCA
jgi:bifunctional non-homologous end joining protein LigD